MAVVAGFVTGLVVFYGLAGYLWTTSIEVVIWRAVKSLKEDK